MFRSLTLCFLLLTTPAAAAGLADSVSTWPGKTYADYYADYQLLCDSLFEGPHRDHARLLELLSEAAAADPTGEWELNRRLVAIHADMYRQRGGGFVIEGDSTAEDFAERFLAVAATAERKRLSMVALRARIDAADCYRIYAQDYQQAFSLYGRLADELSGIPTRDFPMRPSVYREIAGLYFSFREYREAETFYRMIVEDAEARSDAHNSYFQALLGLGLCYRYDGSDYERSDSCFHALYEGIAVAQPSVRAVWSGIALGSLGKNRYLTGDFDGALPLLQAAVQQISRPNDYPFLSDVHVCLADIYIHKHDLRAASEHIDRAFDLYEQSGIPDKNPEMYRVQGHYLAALGKIEQASKQMDSALRAVARQNEAYSGLILRRVEQQLRDADNRISRQKIGFYRLLTLIVSGVLVLISLLLALIASLYRKKRRAYHELVRQNQKWAGVAIDTEEPAPDEALPEPDDEAARTIPDAMPATVSDAKPAAVTAVHPDPAQSDPVQPDRTP